MKSSRCAERQQLLYPTELISEAPQAGDTRMTTE